jgi:nitric oxide reductase NorD protein
VQASLVAAGSLDPGLVRSLTRRAQLRRRYLTLEGHRALVANEMVLPRSMLGLIDRQVAADLPDPAASLERARGRGPVAEPPSAFGVIRPRQLLAADGRADPPSGRAGLSPRTLEAVDLGALDELADDGGDEVTADLLSSPVGGGGAVGRLLGRLMAEVRRRGGGGPVGADTPTHRTASSRAGHRVTVSSPRPAALEGSPEVGRRGHSHPEWDGQRQCYRPDWCTVTELDPPTLAAPTVTWPDGHALRPPLARLGLELTRCRRRRQGDDIDVDAAVEARADAMAGSPHDDDLYVESLRRRRDLAVLVLLDISASAGEPGAFGQTVHEHQRSVAASLTAALHRLGDRVALYAFRSSGRRGVQLLRVKAFYDHLDGDAARRLHSLEPGAYTRLGAAIRHGTSILEERGGTPRQLLVVLSDGLAYDHGYVGRYGVADARRALVEARRRGVGCLCLSIGSTTEPSVLGRVFGTSAHAAVTRADELPALIGPLFRAALRSAEAQRRTFQRQERTRERLEIERRADDRDPAAVLPARR